MRRISVGNSAIRDVAVVLTMLVMSEASLSCDWSNGEGQLRPLITSGSLVSAEAFSLEGCQHQCLRMTSFLCAAVNYQSDTQACQMLAENDQTASIDINSGGRYSIRPACAGLWRPWMATKSNDFHPGVTKYSSSAESLRDCMSNCLETITGIDCRAVVKSTTNDSCQVVDKQSGDEGVALRPSGQFQYFDRPSWYLDSSPGVTNTPILYRQDTGHGSSVQLYINYIIPVDGYLVAWQYYTSRITRACDSYATIWRNDSQSNTYNRIIETEITPADKEGVKFQFVQDTIAMVRAGDFIGLYNNETGCDGHVIGYRNGGEQVRVYSGSNRQSRPSTISSLISDELQMTSRSASVKAYIAGFIVMESALLATHASPPTHESIRLQWQQPAEYQTGSGYVKIDCSTDSNFQSTVDCQPNRVPIEEEGAMLSLPDVTQPYYARVYIVRHYQEQELIQNPDDRYYLVNGGNPFCSDRGELTDDDVVMTETMTADSSLSVEISLPSIVTDNCVQSVDINYGTDSLSGQDKSQSWTFTKGLGETFRLTIELLLVDGHRALVWNKDYIVGNGGLSTPRQPLSSTTTITTTTTSFTTSPTFTTTTTTSTSPETTRHRTTITTSTSATEKSTASTLSVTTTTPTPVRETSSKTSSRVTSESTSTPFTATTITSAVSWPSVTLTSSTTSKGTSESSNGSALGANSSELTLHVVIAFGVVVVVIVIVLLVLAIVRHRRQHRAPIHVHSGSRSVENGYGDMLPPSDKLSSNKQSCAMQLSSCDSRASSIRSLKYEDPLPTSPAPDPPDYVDMQGSTAARSSVTSASSIYEPVKIRSESDNLDESKEYAQNRENDLKES